MNFYLKLTLALALVSGVTAGLLSLTASLTAPQIAIRQAEEQEAALYQVFFHQVKEKDGAVLFQLAVEPLANGVVALRETGQGLDTPPSYYAATGSAIGYNPSAPITLMVGFTAAREGVDKLLSGYLEAERLPKSLKNAHYIVGFSVISSTETPGLGERIRDSRPTFTWQDFLSGQEVDDHPDRATNFQRQFRGKTMEELVWRRQGGDLDAITASTITSNAVAVALVDAAEKLALTLRQNPEKRE
ncbi:MAG: FMN-binding protein [Planctomycetota bacterium]|jgi:Na+-translocating ferredoxin:NAD+ oxidoreductase RnfG subunit|nr:FMN-binding protein [Planctomycetota bacterium]